jgi:hypothetical protein
VICRSCGYVLEHFDEVARITGKHLDTLSFDNEVCTAPLTRTVRPLSFSYRLFAIWMLPRVSSAGLSATALIFSRASSTRTWPPHMPQLFPNCRAAESSAEGAGTGQCSI